MRIAPIFFALLMLAQAVLADAPKLRLPARSATALGGMQVAKEILDLPARQREERIWKEVTAGNVPEFLRQMQPVKVAAEVDGREMIGHIFVIPDYLAVGSNDDYFFIPLTPYTAQRIADQLGSCLPTPKMVDDIYSAADVKLTPSPIPPSPAMTTVSVFLDHNSAVGKQRAAELREHPLGALVAGDKKDIVVCTHLAEHPGHVAIYGWHKPDGKPIQPLYMGHLDSWADYSHGTRLISETMEIDGKTMRVDQVLADPKLCVLLNYEGPVVVSRYKT